MAGLFRFNSMENSTPKRRQSSAAFCLSPSLLRDVTMDNSYALGYRSPNMQHGGNSSPGQGRSVREFEDQMATLRNENFNLKLRIYFLEQKIPGYNQSANSSSDGHDNFLKQNVDLKVDIEVLKKELQEKQSLIGEAAEAMKIMEESEEKNRAIIEELSLKIQYLEEENKPFEKSANQHQIHQLMGRSDVTGDVDILQKIRELEGQVKQYEEKTEELISKRAELEHTATSREELLKERQNKMKQLEFQIAELQEQLDEKTQESTSLEKYGQRLKKLASEKDTDIDRLASENKSLHMTLSKLERELEREKTNFHDRNRRLKEQQQLMEQMQSTIISKKNNVAKLAKTVEEYETVIDELRAEQHVLCDENCNLKDIIVKLEHCKHRETQWNRNMEIYLGGKRALASSARDDRQQHERRRLLSSDHQKKHGSNQFLTNPLFHQLVDDLGSIGDTGESRSTDLRLKEKLRYDSINTINTSETVMYQDHPGFYIHKTATCHKGNLDGVRHGKVKGDVRQQELNDDSKKEEQLCPPNVESITSSQDDNCSTITNNSESSESSLISCNSNIYQMSQLNPSPDVENVQTKKRNSAPKKLREELQKSKSELANKACELSDVQEGLHEKSRLYEKSCKAIQKLMAKTKELQGEVAKLKERNGTQSMTDVDEDLGSLCAMPQSVSLPENGTSSPQRIDFEAKLAKKDAEIAVLKQELKKKTANLQNLVNKELWEKNREIERLVKLTNHCNRSSGSLVDDLKPLQQSFSDSDYSQAVEQNKQLQLKVDKLIHKLSLANERNAGESVEELKRQIREAREDAEQAENWRKECANICTVVTARLEELAGFLHSLLQHKDVLVALGADRKRAMRLAVDRSFELSRSLNQISTSFTSSGENTYDFIANISNMLDLTYNKENTTNNFSNDSLEPRNSQVIENLKAEVKALKKELNKKKCSDSTKKERRSLPLKLENQSESEAWSEPDRNVSLARIGLEESLGAKIVQKARDEDDANTSSDSITDPSRKCKSKYHDKIAHLEQVISQNEAKILQVQSDLVDADNRLKEETLRRVDISRELEDCRKLNGMLEAEMDLLRGNAIKYEEAFNKVDIYRRQSDEKQAAMDKLAEIRDQLSVDIRTAETEIVSLKEKQETMQQKYERDLQQALLQEQKRTSTIESEISRKYEEKLEQLEKNHKEYLARDWISRIIYEQTKRELEDVQKRLTESQFTIEFLRENESEINAQLIENEKQRRSLSQNLNEATLQTTKIVVERTKAVTEKMQLQAELQKLVTELMSAKHERDEILERNELLNNQLLKATAEMKEAVEHVGSDTSPSGSGYASEDVMVAESKRNVRNVFQRLDNSSPDLGIESDAGRTSSTDQGSGNNLTSHGVIVRPKPELHHLNIVDEVSQSVSSTTPSHPAESSDSEDIVNNNDDIGAIQPNAAGVTHDCAKVEMELAEQRNKVIRLRRALEKTFACLRASNERKETLERDIRNQILKTQNVLKNVRANMEN